MNKVWCSHTMKHLFSYLQKKRRGFPGGSVVKYLPVPVGDTGSVFGREGPTCSRETTPVHTAPEPVLWSLGATATAARTPRQEKPEQPNQTAAPSHRG